MARGRKTGGRQKGTPNKPAKSARVMLRREWDKAKAASNITPLDFMLKIMWDHHQTKELRFEAAKAAAPYVHAKLASIDHNLLTKRLTDLTHGELLELRKRYAATLTLAPTIIDMDGTAETSSADES
jgi:hypothetical protein